MTSPTAGWRYIGTRTRLVAMAVVGAVALVLTGLLGRWSDAPVAGWDAMALVFVAWVWCSIGVMDATLTRAHATREDPGRAASDIIVVLAAVASLAAVGVVLVQANAANGTARGLLAGLGVASIALSWLSVNTLFTLRYALLYYSPAAGGIDFNSDEPPCYSDFAYLAFTIGMTYQVSDTDISRRTIRASLLRHSLLSYLLGAVVLASSINLVVAIGS